METGLNIRTRWKAVQGPLTVLDLKGVERGFQPQSGTGSDSPADTGGVGEE